MADDIDELLGEVESKFIPGNSVSSTEVTTSYFDGFKTECPEELDAAINSINNSPHSVEISSFPCNGSLNLNKNLKEKFKVQYVGDVDPAFVFGSSDECTQRKPIQRRHKNGSTTNIHTKKYFTKPVFELSVKDLEAEHTRRKQKELIERLFENKLAVVTQKIILNAHKYKRIKSEVWQDFGDIRLLISEDEVKKLNIDHHVIHINKEEILLCKSFVACANCHAVFSYESHSYGTSTLRSHLKSCGKVRTKSKQPKRLTGSLSDMKIADSYNQTAKPVFQEQISKFRDHATKFQEQILLFFISKLKPFSLMENLEFKDLLQTFIQIGATTGNADLVRYLCTPHNLSEFMLNEVYAQSEEAFRNEIQFLYGLSFSASIWVNSGTKNSYLTLSCHYANSEGLLKSVNYYTVDFPYEQKASNDFLELFNCSLPCMHLDYKKLLVIDYSCNMVHAFKSNEQFIQCICFAISSAVQTTITALTTPEVKEFADGQDTMNALITPDQKEFISKQDIINDLSYDEKELVDEEKVDEKELVDEKKVDEKGLEDPYAFACFVTLLDQCKALVSHFKDNNLQSSLPRSLQMCSVTSWKEVLRMFELINSQWDHITEVLSDRHELELLYLDIELLGLVVDFLEIFRDGYNELVSLSSPTLNLVLIWITRWKTHCLQNEDEPPFLAAMKSFMISSIDEQVTQRITIHHKIASMFDPRYKDLSFLTVYDKMETQAYAEFLVRECHETLLMNGIDIHNSNDPLAEMYDSSNEDNLSRVSPNEEVNEYLNEDFTWDKLDLDQDSKFNPLQYWVRAKTRYPYLSRVALWILSCPASAIRMDDCCTSEWMVTSHETDFSPKDIHKCLFIKSFRNFHSKSL